MLQAAPGQWYIAVMCNCGRRLLVFHDLNEGTAPLLQSQIVITCPECKKFGAYQAEHYQEPAKSEDALDYSALSRS